jgi:hypothetical protein
MVNSTNDNPNGQKANSIWIDGMIGTLPSSFDALWIIDIGGTLSSSQTAQTPECIVVVPVAPTVAVVVIDSLLL